MLIFFEAWIVTDGSLFGAQIQAGTYLRLQVHYRSIRPVVTKLISCVWNAFVAKTFLDLHVKWPKLWSYPDTWDISTRCALLPHVIQENPSCDPRWYRKCNLVFVFVWSACNYYPSVSKLETCLRNVHRLLNTYFHENTSNGCRDRGKNVLCSSCKVSVTTVRSWRNLRCFYVMPVVL